ncbi:uncharacterized protein LOC106177554 [Lingula anatina]|uniref:Uncharacterized protein LOC106177554 n=1 Tax=Lingula anatina TaxID=7574 RepID=A0A1S3JZK9_LINAN|nr:uncharacterized protein LOC106177554 [Lingula anatina]|eukprot:XP_013415833.1 uncharacterized protein LOC106177554 [Lingula anatina]
MATAKTHTDSGQENFFRMSILIVDYALKVVQDILQKELRKKYPNLFDPNTGFLNKVLSDKTVWNLLLGLSPKIFNHHQRNQLYPAGNPSTSVTVGDLDLTLTVLLLRNVTSLNPHPRLNAWDNPSDTDPSTEATIGRIKRYRNTVYGHANKAAISDHDFRAYFSGLKSNLLVLSSRFTNEDYDTILCEPLDASLLRKYWGVLEEWSNYDEDVKYTIGAGFKRISEEITQLFDGQSELKKLCLGKDQHEQNTKEIIMACDPWKLAIQKDYESLQQGSSEATNTVPTCTQDVKDEPSSAQCKTEQPLQQNSVKETTNIPIPPTDEERTDRPCSCQCESIPSRGYYHLTCHKCLLPYSIVLFILTSFRYIWQQLKHIYQVLRPIPYHVFIYSKLLFVLTPFKYVRHLMKRFYQVSMQLLHPLAQQTRNDMIEPWVSGSNTQRLVYLFHFVGYNLAWIHVLFVMMPGMIFTTIFITLILSCILGNATQNRLITSAYRTFKAIVSPSQKFWGTLFVLCSCVVRFYMLPALINVEFIFVFVLTILLIVILLVEYYMVESVLVSIPKSSLIIMNILDNVCSLVCFFNTPSFLLSYPLLHIVLCSILISHIDDKLHMYVSLRHLRSQFTCDSNKIIVWYLLLHILLLMCDKEAVSYPLVASDQDNRVQIDSLLYYMVTNMTTLWKLAIKKNSTELMKDMEVSEMMPYLYENNILTDHQHDDIQNATGRETRGKILLGYILRKDPALDPFGHFICALQCTNQNHLAESLTNSYNWLEQEGYGNMDVPEEILNDPCICNFESAPTLSV